MTVIRPEEKMFTLTLTKESALQLLIIFNEHAEAAQESGLVMVQQMAKDLRAIVLAKANTEQTLSYSKEGTLDLFLFIKEFSMASRPDKFHAACVETALQLMEQFISGGDIVGK